MTDAIITSVSNADVSTVPTAAAAPVAAASAAPIVFTVKANDIVKAKVANIKNHPPKGVLVVIEGNPMAFMPNACIAGKDEEEKANRRTGLVGNPGYEISVSILGEPTIETVHGRQVGRIKVSEQRAVFAAEKAEREAQYAERKAEHKAAIAAAVASLVEGSVITGAVRGPATKDSDREPGTKYTFGVYVGVAPDLSGLLHVKAIEGGDRGIDRILAAASVDVVIVSAKMVDGKPRIELSQVKAAQTALATWAMDRLGKKVKGKVVKTGEMAGDLHGRIIELLSGDRVFLCDDDMNVKSETSLTKGNTTTVIITDQIVGGMVRVTRRGA